MEESKVIDTNTGKPIGITYPMTLDEAVRIMRREVKNGYALVYINALDKCKTPEAVRVQILYILNNITGWRGPEARRVKKFLRGGKAHEA